MVGRRLAGYEFKRWMNLKRWVRRFMGCGAWRLIHLRAGQLGLLGTWLVPRAAVKDPVLSRLALDFGGFWGPWGPSWGFLGAFLGPLGSNKSGKRECECKKVW